MRASLWGMALGCGLWACGSESPVSPVPGPRDIGLELRSPSSLQVEAGTDTVLLAWAYDSLSGSLSAVVNDSLRVPAGALHARSLSLRVAVAPGENRFVLRLSDGNGTWVDTVVLTRGALEPAVLPTLRSPRMDTGHAWEDSVVTVRWALSAGTLDSASFAGQVVRQVRDSLRFRVVLKPGPDTLRLVARDRFGREVRDSVVTGRAFFTGLGDSLSNLVVGRWGADTAMPVPQGMRDSLSLSPAYSAYKIQVDSVQSVRYEMVLGTDLTFASLASLRFRATVFSGAAAVDEWVDSVYADRGTWKVVGDSLEITRTSCSKALSPYIRLVDPGALLDESDSTKGLGVSTDRSDVCSPVVSRARIVLQGQAWPITVSGLLPGQDVALRFVRTR